jgi:hypothetical protein
MTARTAWRSCVRAERAWGQRDAPKFRQPQLEFLDRLRAGNVLCGIARLSLRTNIHISV